LIAPWCAERGVEPGAVLPAALVWTLSQRWYHDRLTEEYRSRSAAQVEEIFRSLGLTSAFWQHTGPADAPQK
jgi:hypothetical protein